MTEIRPLRWYDLPFAYRLAGHGISLDAQLGLTVGSDSLQHALLTSTGRIHICVLRQRGNSGLGALHYPVQTQHARLAYLAPSLEQGASEKLWVDLLDGLTAVAGQRGVVNIIAEVDEGSRAQDTLRQAHFGVYARQDLWERPPMRVGSAETGPLRLARGWETQAILSLYGALAPPLIRQVEPPPTTAEACYVLDGPQGLCGVIAVYQGAHGVLTDVYLHPQVYQEAHTVLSALLVVLRASKRPVYCRLRGYMGYLSNALSKLGFSFLTTQAVMVRHTAVRVMQHAFKLSSAVEKGGLTTTTPIHKRNGIGFVCRVGYNIWPNSEERWLKRGYGAAYYRRSG